jgi:hypothetical protein
LEAPNSRSPKAHYPSEPQTLHHLAQYTLAPALDRRITKNR